MNEKRYRQLKKLALKTLKSLRLHGTPTNAKEAARRLGINLYSIADLSQTKRELHAVPEGKSAVLLIENGVKSLYYDPSSPYADLSIYHEIAHDILSHQADGAQEEEEAKTLAALLLYPPTDPDEGRNKRKVPFALLVVLLMLSIILVPHALQIAAEKLESQDITEELVYITKSGDKYHRLDCQYIKDKDYVIELIKIEARRAGYEPCKICRP